MYLYTITTIKTIVVIIIMYIYIYQNNSNNSNIYIYICIISHRMQLVRPTYLSRRPHLVIRNFEFSDRIRFGMWRINSELCISKLL